MKKPIQCFCIIFIVFGASLGLVQAQELQGPAEDADRIRKVTAAVALLRAGARDENDWLLVPPFYLRVREQKTRKDVIQKGRYEMVDVRKPIFEKFEDVGTKTSNYEDSIGKVRKRRIIGYEIVKEKKFIPDPNGSESRTIQQNDPKADRYRVDTPTLYNGFWGANGMAIDSFIRLGISPEDEEFSRCIQTLADFLEVYGLPDTTFDLAWLAVGFSAVAKENPLYSNLATRCTHKLLLGQQQDSRIAGMWGPVCVNTRLLALAIEEKQNVFDKQLSKLVEELEKETDERKKEKIQDKINEAEKVFSSFQAKLQDISTHAFSMGNLTKGGTLPGEVARTSLGGYPLEEARYHGLPVNIYAEQVVDLESTATALYALSVVFERGLLPGTVSIPKNLRGQPLMQFPATRQLITQSAGAVLNLQNQAGAFTEGIQWIPVTDFKDLVVGVDQVVLPEKPFPDLVTPESCAYGASALLSSAVLLRQDPRGLSVRLQKAVDFSIAELKKWQLGDESSQLYVSQMGMERLLLPLQTLTPMVEEWQEIESGLIDDWDVTGEDKAGYYTAGSPGHRELKLFRMEELYNIKPNKKGDKKPFDRERSLRGAVYNNDWRFYDRQRIPNLIHIRILTRSQSSSVAAAWSWNGEAPRTTRLDPVLDVLSKEQGMKISTQMLPTDLSKAETEGLAMVFVSGNGAFPSSSPESSDKIREVVNAGGILACEAPASPEGMQFLKEISQFIFEGAGELKETKVGSHTVYGVTKDEKVQAIFLPLGAVSPEIKLAKSPADASRILYEALKQHPVFTQDRMPYVDWATLLEFEVAQPDMTAARLWADERL